MTNEQAIAYMVLSMRACNYSQKQAREMYFEMRAQMDEMTEEEAVEQANSFLYGQERP